MWNETFNKTLIKMRSERFKIDPYIYIIKHNNKKICILEVYVDDIIIA